MSITTILNLYRRPHLLDQQIDYILQQSRKCDEIWLWINNHEDSNQFDIKSLSLYKHISRIVRSDYNWKFFGRFSLAMMARTEYVAIFDDDTMPAKHWFNNCLKTIEKTGHSILGGAGVILNSNIYNDHRRVGWPSRNINIEQVDLVGHAWFFPKSILKYIWYEEPITLDNGEDIHFSFMCQKYGNVNTYCPPHNIIDNTSSLFPQLGIDDKTASVTNHQEFFTQRNLCVQNAIDNGWATLFNKK